MGGARGGFLSLKKKIIIPYNHDLVDKAKQLRKNATYSERLLWKYLRGKQFEGLDFDRQKPIDKFIVDFFCNEMRLVIEIDGVTHNDKQEYDKYRQDKLEELGLSVLRYDALDVVNNIEGVLTDLRAWVQMNRIPTPYPSQEGK